MLKRLLPFVVVAIVTMLIAWVLLTFRLPGKWTVILAAGVAAFVAAFVVSRWFHPDNRYYRFAWSSFGAAATSGAIPTIRAIVDAEAKTKETSWLLRLPDYFEIDGAHAGVSIAFVVLAGGALLLDYKERKRRVQLITKPANTLTRQELDDLIDLAKQEKKKRRNEIAKKRRNLRDRNKWPNE